MSLAERYPLDLEQTSYSYVERPNEVLLDLLTRHVLGSTRTARILDIGCGAGANARAIRARFPKATLCGIEPNEHAIALAREVFDEMFHGLSSDWLKTSPKTSYDAVILSDVVEHIPDPVTALRDLVSAPALKNATWIVSVPNYAVWYNRVRTLAGSFEYGWSGLYDRTHLRFFTRRSIHELLRYVGLDVLDDKCTPSIVQSLAPVLRSFFEKDVTQGNHLSLTESKPFQLYSKYVEPVETAACQLAPSLLGFQIVTAARRA